MILMLGLVIEVFTDLRDKYGRELTIGFGTTVFIANLIQLYFFIQLKNVRIWLESKNPEELKENLNKFKKLQYTFYATIILSMAILTLLYFFTEGPPVKDGKKSISLTF
jgi:branched-subunit amino acid ABC-type transport system permease component